MTSDDFMAAVNAAAKAATVDGWNARFKSHLRKAGLQIVAATKAEGDHQVSAPHPMPDQTPTWGQDAVIVEITADA